MGESLRVSAVPRRPAWRDSDPRWRRRMLAGTWILALVPVMDALKAFGWSSCVPAPNVFDYRGAVLTLDDTLASLPWVYPPIIFCVGVVLLFSNERGGRAGRLDFTRRWGVLCSYVVSILSAASVLYVAALVFTGVAAIFLSVRPHYQPSATNFLVNVSTGYLRYGPQFMDAAAIALVAFSSIAILLACVPLFDALRGSGRPWVAAILLAPLALFALMYLAQVGRHLIFPSPDSANVFQVPLYFAPEQSIRRLTGLPNDGWTSAAETGEVIVEVAKWAVVVVCAVWLTVAQCAAWRRGTRASAA